MVYVDTSFENPTAVDGVTYFNTANGTSGCPSVTGCGWKPNYNRTDDPLGADADQLCAVIPTVVERTFTVKAAPKASVNVSFYTDEDCTEAITTVVNDGVVGNYHQYTVTAPEGWVYYRGTDGSVDLGGDAFAVQLKNFYNANNLKKVRTPKKDRIGTRLFLWGLTH